MFQKSARALINAQMVNGWTGSDLKVDIASDVSYRAQVGSGGSIGPSETVETMQATLTPITFSVSPRITRDLIESSEPAILEWHLNNAAQALGRARCLIDAQLY
jgi:hypothetical protein